MSEANEWDIVFCHESIKCISLSQRVMFFLLYRPILYRAESKAQTSKKSYVNFCSSAAEISWISHFFRFRKKIECIWSFLARACIFQLLVKWFYVGLSELTTLLLVAIIQPAFGNVEPCNGAKWRHRYPHMWGYGKYATTVPDVVSYEFYKWCISQ